MPNSMGFFSAEALPRVRSAQQKQLKTSKKCCMCVCRVFVLYCIVIVFVKLRFLWHYVANLSKKMLVIFLRSAII